MVARVPSKMPTIASPTAARSVARQLAGCLSAAFKPALGTVAADDTQNAQICTKITVSLNKPRYAQNGGSARGYLAVGGPLSSPGMAYWMVA
jgi:hypothetical protein